MPFFPTYDKAKTIKITPKTKKEFNKALNITLGNKKEIGVYVCGNQKSDTITFTDATIRTSSDLDKNSFQFNPNAFPSIERATCRNDDKLIALAHTHPNGNAIPSQRDRIASQQTDMVGCVIGKNESYCYYGKKDFRTIIE